MPIRFYDNHLANASPPAIVISVPVVNNVAFYVNVVSDSAFHLPGFEEADEIRENFVQLADEWHTETGHLSASTQIAMHPAYQRIIGMGQEVVPLILSDLRARGGYWYWALSAITDASPVPDDAVGNMRAVRNAWLDWGLQRGYLFSKP